MRQSSRGDAKGIGTPSISQRFSRIKNGSPGKKPSSSVVICFSPSTGGKPGFPGLPLSGLLGADEGFGVHPIRVTQFAQRADLELIDPGKREPIDG